MQYLDILGASLIITAYGFMHAEIFKKESTLYLCLNMVGAIILAIKACDDKLVGFFLLQCFWFLVSFVSLIKNSIDKGDGLNP